MLGEIGLAALIPNEWGKGQCATGVKSFESQMISRSVKGVNSP